MTIVSIRPAGDTGNASNPSPAQEPQPQKDQLISEKGENYLREVASIEDLPDAQDQQDMDEELEKE